MQNILIMQEITSVKLLFMRVLFVLSYLSVCTVVKVVKHTLSITVSVMFKGVQSFCSSNCYI